MPRNRAAMRCSCVPTRGRRVRMEERGEGVDPHEQLEYGCLSVERMDIYANQIPHQSCRNRRHELEEVRVVSPFHVMG